MSIARRITLIAGVAASLTIGLPTIPAVPSPTATIAHAATVLMVTQTYAGDHTCPSPAGSESPLSINCAIAQANADGSGDTINFNIPVGRPSDNGNTDSGCVPETVGGSSVPVCTIAPTSPLVLTASNTTINAYTQADASPNTNTTVGAGSNAVLSVELSCQSPGCPSEALDVTGSNNVIEGFAISGVRPHLYNSALTYGEAGIKLESAGSGNVLEGNFIGVNPDGTAAAATIVNSEGFPDAGVMIQGSGGDTVGTGSGVPCGTNASPGPLCAENVISNNGHGIFISANPTSRAPAANDTVSGNLLGTGPDGTSAQGNTSVGISIVAGSNSAIAGNLIANSEGNGISIVGTGSVTRNTIIDNGAGKNASGLLIGETSNLPTNPAPDPNTHILVSRNIIHGSGNLELDLAPQGHDDCAVSAQGPNGYTPCPVITGATASQITGTACASCVVEVFIAGSGPNDGQQGGSQAYLNSATANGAGSWTLALSSGQFDPSNQQVTATATTPSTPGPAETSEFARDFPTRDFTVTTTIDNAPLTSCPNGPGQPSYTLRCAIVDAVSQENNWGDTISFDIPSSDPGCDPVSHVCTISPVAPLPRITSLSTVIDGYTQAGAQPNTNAALSAGDNAKIRIRIDGGGAGSGANGLTLLGGHDLVTGLSVTGFSGNGIGLAYQRAMDDTIQGDFVGVTPAGGKAANGGDGINVGLDSASAGFFNTTFLAPTFTSIGGTNPAARNVISGNTLNGVHTVRSANTTIQENYIGTDPTGTSILGNSGDGVMLASAGHDVIGGATSQGSPGNVISGNGSNGVEDVGELFNSLQGNRVGTNAAGTAALPNGNDGALVSFVCCPSPAQGLFPAIIGGTSPGAGNIISGNTNNGIELPASTNFSVYGNTIGTDSSGTLNLGNGANGVYVRGFRQPGGFDDNSAGNIGSISQTNAAANFISHNSGAGVFIGLDSLDQATKVAVNGNSIYDNGSTGSPGLGIDLYPPGLSCTSGSGAPVPNGGILCPVITSATASLVSGSACAGCRVEVFQATNEADDTVSGVTHGEGQSYLNFAMADGGGHWTLSGSFAGLRLTATATQLDTSSPPDAVATSEFSADVTATMTSAVPGVVRTGRRPFRRVPRVTRPAPMETPRILRLPKSRPGLRSCAVSASAVASGGHAIRDAAGHILISPDAPGHHLVGPKHALFAGPAPGPLTRRFKRVLASKSQRAAPPSPCSLLLPTSLYLPPARQNAGRAYGRRREGAPKAGRLLTRPASRRRGARRVRSNRSPPTLLTVTTTRDVACGDQAGMSLRCAITTANADAGGNPITVDFRILLGCNPTTGVCQLSPIQPLPSVTRNGVTIDGYGQPGIGGASAHANTSSTLAAGDNALILIEIDGQAYGPDATGLDMAAANDAVQGLSITHFTRSNNALNTLLGSGIRTESSSTVTGNFIGLDPAGSPEPNLFGVAAAGSGTQVGATTADGANVVSGNVINLAACGVTNMQVQGNLIGTDPSGEKPVANNGDGIYFASGTDCGGTNSNNVPANDIVGGSTTGAGNVISGNNPVGIDLSGSNNTTVQGNLIGTDAAGTHALGNVNGGVAVLGGSSNVVGPDNVISGNGAGLQAKGNFLATGGGVLVVGTYFAAGNLPQTRIEGNKIGTDVTGAAAIPNQGNGVSLLGGSLNDDVTIGPQNVISGNTGVGVQTGCDTNLVIQGNEIGTNAAGTGALGNTVAGILTGCVSGRTQNEVIGGTIASARNVISGNGSFEQFISNQCVCNGIDLLAYRFTVEGNYIGTNAAGTAAIPNQGNGIAFFATCLSLGCTIPTVTQSETIGVPGAGNLIGGNGAAGFGGGYGLFGGCQNCSVVANRIGTTADGQGPISNFLGGIALGSGYNVTIGGASVGSGNLIAHNLGLGLIIGAGVPGEIPHVGVQRNLIYDNGGAELSLQGQPLQSCGSPPAAANVPNDNIACPVTTGEILNAGNSLVTEIGGSAPMNSTVEVYTATNGIDDSTHGGSQVYLGTVTATGTSCTPSPCPSGTGSWSLPSTAFMGGFALVPQQPVTATATLSLPNPYGTGTAYDTSVFAADFASLTRIDYTVTGTGSTLSGTPCDNQDGSFVGTIDLSCAISAANLAPGQTVRFDIPTGRPGDSRTPDPGCKATQVQGQPVPVCTIALTDPLPPLTADNLTIDGYTQPGGCSSPPCVNTNPVGQPDNAVLTVRLDGAGLKNTNDIHGSCAQGLSSHPCGLDVIGNTDTIRGLAFTQFFNPAGFGSGTAIVDSAGNSTIIAGDFVGTDPAGASGLGNASGIEVDGAGGTIGGTSPAARNVISGNSSAGMVVQGASGNLIEGNYIGTNLAGVSAMGNGTGVVLGGDGALLGGTSASARNVISGNQSDGVYVCQFSCVLNGFSFADALNIVEGNYIGTNATGTSAVPNSPYGIELNGAFGNTVGGAGPGSANLISGNAGAGVAVDFYSNHNLVEGNDIGTSASDTTPLANGSAPVRLTRGPAISPSASAIRFVRREALKPGPLHVRWRRLLKMLLSGTGANQRAGLLAGGRSGHGEPRVRSLGASAPPNSGAGVLVDGSLGTPNSIGPGNVIAGNQGSGVELTNGDGGGPNNVVGNLIGLDSSGHPRGNTGAGVYAHDGAFGVIGGSGAGQTNSIAHNGLSGIQIGASSSDSATHMAISHNLIHDNLSGGSVTLTNAGEIYLTGQNTSTCATTTSVPGKPNDAIPCPIVEPPRINSVTVKTCGGCTVELFTSKDREPNDQLAGGSAQFLGALKDTGAACTPGSGGGCGDSQGSVTFTGLASITSLTATATSPDGSETSEFAHDVGTPTWARVARFTASRSGRQLTFRWRITDRSGVAGFGVYSASHRLDARIISVHNNRAYEWRIKLRGDRSSWLRGPFLLHVILTRGGQVVVPAL